METDEPNDTPPPLTLLVDPIAKSTVTDYTYTTKDNGPFRVYVEPLIKQHKSSVNKIAVGRMLKKIFGVERHVTEIKNAGRQKVLVYLNNFTALLKAMDIKHIYRSI